MPFTDFLPGLFRKADPEPTLPEPVALTDPLASWLFGGAPTYSNISVTPKTAVQVPAVASAVTLIADAVGTLPVKLYVRNGKGKKADTAHLAFTLAHDEANGWTSAAELRTQLTRDALLHDNGGFAAAVRSNTGNVVEFIRLDPATVDCKADEATGEPFYLVRQGRKNVRYEYWDILHVRHDDGAPINLARNAIALAIDLERHAAKLFSNGARPSGILSTDAKTPAALKNIADMWNATFGDPSNTGNAFGRLADRLIDMALDSLINSLFDNLLGGLGGGLFGGALGLADGGEVHAATGGLIRGPGTSTSDSIPARLSDGEFVVNAAATRRNMDLLRAINDGKIAAFAAGGLAGDSPTIRAANDNIGRNAAPVINISTPVTVNANGGDPAQNADLAKRIGKQMEATMRGVVSSEIAKQMRPGNAMNTRSR